MINQKNLIQKLNDLHGIYGKALNITLLMENVHPGRYWSWLPKTAINSKTGLVAISVKKSSGDFSPIIALAPPFPLLNKGNFDTEKFLSSEMNRTFNIAIILLRLGYYAFGIAENGNLVISKTGSRYVKNRQRQGGQSATRFQRNREKWIQQLFNEVTSVAKERIKSYQKHIDWIIFGGDKQVITQYRKKLLLPNKLQESSLPWLIPVERPNKMELSRSVKTIWSWRAWQTPICV